MTWRGWQLEPGDGGWLLARRRIGDVLHTVMVRRRSLGGYRAAVYRATWPVESRATVDAATAEEALDAAAKAAGMALPPAGGGH